MQNSNILQFPSRVRPDHNVEPSADLLAKITSALQDMKQIHAELETLKANLKAQQEALPQE